jgi:hypothetical protein
MGYQMKKEMKIKLAFIFWEIICRQPKLGHADRQSSQACPLAFSMMPEIPSSPSSRE